MKTYQNDQINKQTDQMYVLLAICLVLHPQRIDESLHSMLKEKSYAEKMNKMQAGDLAEFEASFTFACPKFLSPVPPPIDGPGPEGTPVMHHKEPLKLQLKVRISLFIFAFPLPLPYVYSMQNCIPTVQVGFIGILFLVRSQFTLARRCGEFVLFADAGIRAREYCVIQWQIIRSYNHGHCDNDQLFFSAN